MRDRHLLVLSKECALRDHHLLVLWWGKGGGPSSDACKMEMAAGGG